MIRGVIVVLILFLAGNAFAKDSPVPASADLLRLSWKASNEGDMDALGMLFEQMISAYEVKARVQAARLSSFPSRDRIDEFRIMNDVATLMFVNAEALMHQGKNEQAKSLFEQVAKKYPWAQAWDPSRGSFWSTKEKSEASISIINGEKPPETEVIKSKRPKTMPHLEFKGTENVINYLKYGNFIHVGTKDYHYQITNQAGLGAAVGEGIYPNLTDIYNDPAYKTALKEGRLEGNHWDFVNTDDLEASVYKWATAPEPWGVKLFYIGIAFEKAKMYYEAIKAYHAIVVHFPNTIAMTYWQTPWYPGQVAIAKIKHIVRMHPELRLEFKWAKIQILNSFDNDPHNDIYITKPGVIGQINALDWAKETLHLDKVKTPLGQVVRKLGAGRVRLVKYENGHWQLLLGDKAFIIKGITYGPTKVGQSPDKGTLTNWMESDENGNGLIDAPNEAWVDKNRNNKQDDDEPSEGDFALMKAMGVNTIRMYHYPMKINKEFLNKMFKDYGFMVIMGDFLGKYAIGSGASWADGTDYENTEHQKAMMQSVKDMVTEYKDEPYILMWMLGNENNYGVASNADKKPDAYYSFLNKVAKMIKSIDSNHPVAVCNGDTLFLDKFAKNAPDVDVYAANVYRGDYGFGSFWQQIAETADRPAFISEYGAPAYGGDQMSLEEAMNAQRDYHRGNWMDIQYNSAGYKDGVGNALGGVVFEWVDEWWKNYEPSVHDTKADVVGPFPGGYYNEEWFGLFGQGDGSHSPYLREPRKMYYTYKEMWNS